MKKPRKTVTQAQLNFSFSRRSLVLGGAQLGLGAILAGRMAWLSIAQNQRYKLLAESNRVNLSLIPPRRGWIVDRNGKPLALNRTVFRVDIIPDRLEDSDAEIDELVKLLGLTPDDRDRIADAVDQAAGFQPVAVAENIDWEKFAAVSIRAADLPGVAPAQGYARYYPAGPGVAHLLGYVGGASAKAYEDSKDPLLITPGFKVGKDGIERVMEDRLRGKPGARRTEVTARGKLVRELATRKDVSGQTMRLTIDAGVQAYASRRMGDASGSCTVLDCQTGDVLAMTSMPAYDPNIFASGISKSEWEMLRSDDHIPLANKTLQGLYPPGSTFKPMVTLALLEAGVDPHATVVCTGSYRVGNSFFHCANRRGHGTISMERALVQSCDIYYYHFGKLIGIDPIAKMARRLALGERHPLPVPSQSFGTVPDPAWLKRKFKRDWGVFDTVNTSIGQGYVLATPLQLAVMAGRIASGRAITPRLLYDHSHRPPPFIGLNPEHLAFVQAAMGGVVNSGIGTASRARLPFRDIHMGGKTGTAQVRRITMAERAGGVRSNASLPWKFRDHALFIAFAPVEAPRYAASVIVEHGGFGAAAAAPIARDVMTYMFDQAKATATLEQLESGWGGDIEARMATKRERWQHRNDPPPEPSVPANNMTTTAAPPSVAPPEKREPDEVPAEASNAAAEAATNASKAAEE
jgi:penicillin-binding protein 2